MCHTTSGARAESSKGTIPDAFNPGLWRNRFYRWKFIRILIVHYIYQEQDGEKWVLLVKRDLLLSCGQPILCYAFRFAQSS